MIRKSLLVVAFALSASLVVAGSQSTKKAVDKNGPIVFLDTETTRNVKRANAAVSPLILDATNKAYVLNKSSFGRLDSSNAKDYLNNGGIIVVDDKTVTSDDLKEKIPTNVADFDYSNLADNYGFYLVNSGTKTVAVNVNAGFVSADSVATTTSLSTTSSTVLSVQTVATSMVASASLSTISVAQNDGGGGPLLDTNTTGSTIAFANMQNILYVDGTTTKACSYSIYTSVFDVAKVLSGTGTIRGVYDVKSAFILDPETSFALTNYSVRMKSPVPYSIIDASVLKSTATTSVSLTGSIPGTVLAGSFTNGLNYTYASDYQTFTTDFSASDSKIWNGKLTYPTTGLPEEIEPTIRIANSDDSATTAEYSRVNSLSIYDYRYIIPMSMSMLDKYRKESMIVFDKYGHISQTTIIG